MFIAVTKPQRAYEHPSRPNTKALPSVGPLPLWPASSRGRNTRFNKCRDIVIPCIHTPLIMRPFSLLAALASLGQATLVSIRGREQPLLSDPDDGSLHMYRPPRIPESLLHLAEAPHEGGSTASICYVKLEDSFSWISLTALDDVTETSSASVTVPRQWLLGTLYPKAPAKVSFLHLHPILRPILPIVTAFIYPPGGGGCPTPYKTFRSSIERIVSRALPHFEGGVREDELALFKQSWAHLLAFVKNSNGHRLDQALIPFTSTYLRSVAAGLTRDTTLIYPEPLVNSLSPIYSVSKKLLFPLPGDIDRLWTVPSIRNLFDAPLAGKLLKDPSILPDFLKLAGGVNGCSRLGNFTTLAKFLAYQMAKSKGQAYSQSLTKAIASFVRSVLLSASRHSQINIIGIIWNAIRFPDTLGHLNWEAVPAANFLRYMSRAAPGFFEVRFISNWRAGEHSSLDYSVAYFMGLLHILQGRSADESHEITIFEAYASFEQGQAYYRLVLMADFYLWLCGERLDTLGSPLDEGKLLLARHVESSLAAILKRESKQLNGEPSDSSRELYIMLRESGPLALKLWLTYRRTQSIDNLTPYLPDFSHLQETIACPNSLAVILSEFPSLLDEKGARSLLVQRALKNGQILCVGDDLTSEVQRNLRIMHLVLSILFAEREEVSPDEDDARVIHVKLRTIVGPSLSAEDIISVVHQLMYVMYNVPYSSTAKHDVSQWISIWHSYHRSVNYKSSEKASGLVQQEKLNLIARLWEELLAKTGLTRRIIIEFEPFPIEMLTDSSGF